MRNVKWSAVMAGILLLLGVVTSLLTASQGNWGGLGVAGVLTLAGVGVAVLSLHER